MHAEIKFDKGDFRLELPMFQGDNFKANLAIHNRLADFATAKGCTLPQLGLAWLLAQGNNVIPIPGTKSTRNLMNNLGAMKVKLTLEDLETIHQTVFPGAVKVARDK